MPLLALGSMALGVFILRAMLSHGLDMRDKFGNESWFLNAAVLLIPMYPFGFGVNRFLAFWNERIMIVGDYVTYFDTMNCNDAVGVMSQVQTCTPKRWLCFDGRLVRLRNGGTFRYTSLISGFDDLTARLEKAAEEKR